MNSRLLEIKRIFLHVSNLSVEEGERILAFFNIRGAKASFIEAEDKESITKKNIIEDNFSPYVRNKTDSIIFDSVDDIDPGTIFSVLGSKLCIMVAENYNILSFLEENKKLFGEPVNS